MISSWALTPSLPTIKIHHPPSPRHSPHNHHHHNSSSTPSSAATPTPTAGARRKIGVAIDLSSESAFAVRWAVDHYIRPGDAVVLLHVSPTSVLYGADWGPLPLKTTPQDQPSQEDFDAFTSSKVADLARPLKESGFPYKIHIVKDHDMRERLCLEIERLGLSAVIMGSRGFGAEKKSGSDDDDDGRLVGMINMVLLIIMNTSKMSKPLLGILVKFALHSLQHPGTQQIK
ncbi:Usp domain-containing protein [Raphanus sativus]|nr:Usp domain-containing protein [Raphanus sativus]